MGERSGNWFANIMGRVADAVGNAIGDARDKVLFEGWFDRAFGPVESPDCPAPDFGDWLSGATSPIAPNPDVGLGCEIKPEPDIHSTPANHDHGIDL